MKLPGAFILPAFLEKGLTPAVVGCEVGRTGEIIGGVGKAETSGDAYKNKQYIYLFLYNISFITYLSIYDIINPEPTTWGLNSSTTTPE